jgi:multiple sugar transport system ATP-binding protein
MTLSTRLAVMKDGKILQFGPPQEIYSEPVDLFTAGFIGSPPMNFLPGELSPFIQGKDLIVGVRPEDWNISLKEIPEGIKGKTTVTETLGSDEFLYIEVSDTLITARLKPGTEIKEDLPIWLTAKKEKMHFFDKKNQKNITSEISKKLS